MSRITNPAAWLRALSVALIVMCASAPLAGANMWTDPIPHSADYEGHSGGDSIIEDAVGGWSADTNTYTTVTNIPVNFSAVNFPLDYNHSNGNVVKLDTEGNAISNLVNDTGYTNVWIDTMIQMVPTDGDMPASVTNGTDIQTAIWLGTNGMLSVYHSYPEDNSTWVDFSNTATELSHDAIETGSWHRLTVVMDYKTAISGFPRDLEFFSIALDGGVITNALGWPAIDSGSLTGGGGGKWFGCANEDEGIVRKMNATVISGTGYLDDFVVTNGAPTFSFPAYYTNGVPGYWLAAYTIEQSDAGAISNSDTDVYLNWEEWLMATDPTVSNDFMVTTASDGSTNWVMWQSSGTIDTAAPDIMIKRGTNLLDGFVATTAYPRASLAVGTNVWTDTTGGNAFYQLQVTN